MCKELMDLQFYNFIILIHLAVRPEAPPEIQGLQPEYALHETVDVMCTSARAFPAAQLDFFVNDEPVSNSARQTLFSCRTFLSGKRLKLILVLERFMSDGFCFLSVMVAQSDNPLVVLFQDQLSPW